MDIGEKYKRVSLIVNARKYAPDMGMEDGFELYTTVITNGWISSENLIKITKADGSIVCPFIQNRRGITFLREGDYIITENDLERHVCGEDKFSSRYLPLD